MIEALRLACRAELHADYCDEWYKQSDKHFISIAPILKDVLKFYNHFHSESISIDTCRRRLHKLEKDGVAISKPLAGANTRWMLIGFIDHI